MQLSRRDHLCLCRTEISNTGKINTFWIGAIFIAERSDLKTQINYTHLMLAVINGGNNAATEFVGQRAFQYIGRGKIGSK